MKHLEVEDLWLQEAVTSERIELSKVACAENPADLLTKHLTRASEDRHLPTLGLRDT